ncbi:uncharacterized protein LOC131429855 [Malaya genurostris]|uniref:uncharacterized protein LOC131429855 n=1 Tax=Malaya genurostris TaxID=325434 RepID=UPI0026F3A8BB|nr:uncharacterized protein LOC131429855 [Malaya genurostris]
MPFFSRKPTDSIVLVSSLVLLSMVLLSDFVPAEAGEVSERNHKAMRPFGLRAVVNEPTTTVANDEQEEEEEEEAETTGTDDADHNNEAGDSDEDDDNGENEQNRVTAGPNHRIVVTTPSSANYVATTPKIIKSSKVMSRYEQGLEDYDEAAERVEREKKQHSFRQQYDTVVQPFLTLFNVISTALSYGRSMGTSGDGLSAVSILGAIRRAANGSGTGAGGNDQNKDINSATSTTGEDDAAQQRENSTAVATVEGRYIKGDPLNGYYDFIISEGSYKFWAVFQVATAVLIIYSTFAAIYYSKVSPLTSDYDYIDYLNGGRSFSGARSATGAVDPWDSLLSKPWFSVATRSFGFVMDAIERVPK